MKQNASSPICKNSMQNIYYIGQIILKNSKWGNKFIDNLSIDLKLEFTNTTGFSLRNLNI